jgi:hypothetical protein
MRDEVRILTRVINNSTPIPYILPILVSATPKHPHHHPTTWKLEACPACLLLYHIPTYTSPNSLVVGVAGLLGGKASSAVGVSTASSVIDAERCTATILSRRERERESAFNTHTRLTAASQAG